MATKKVLLSQQSLNDLAQYINSIARELIKVETVELQELAYGAASEILMRAGGMPFDGNQAGGTDIEFTRGKVLVKWVGADVAFKEFGYGAKGKSAPHKSGLAWQGHMAWGYGNRTTWSYRSDKGSYMTSQGQSGQIAPMWRTAQGLHARTGGPRSFKARAIARLNRKMRTR